MSEEETAAFRRGGNQRHVANAHGSQIRSYTLHPEQRVKDHRTGLEVKSAVEILDGDLDALIEAELIRRAVA